MNVSFSEMMDIVDNQVKFCETERNIAFKKIEEINGCYHLPIEYKNEMYENWMKHINTLENILNDNLSLKRKLIMSLEQ